MAIAHYPTVLPIMPLPNYTETINEGLFDAIYE